MSNTRGVRLAFKSVFKNTLVWNHFDRLFCRLGNPYPRAGRSLVPLAPASSPGLPGHSSVCLEHLVLLNLEPSLAHRFSQEQLNGSFSLVTHLRAFWCDARVCRVVSPTPSLTLEPVCAPCPLSHSFLNTVLFRGQAVLHSPPETG